MTDAWWRRHPLGPERSMFGIDSEWLVVRFGADGRVHDARILTD